MAGIVLEVCVDTIESVYQAQEAGAQRLELCSALAMGGLTPSVGLIKQSQHASSLLQHVLIRPRAGDFCYSPREFTNMIYDIEAVKDLGVHGVVVGALNPNRTINIKALKTIIAAARPLSITFHRAFDLVKDPFQALEQLIDLGIDRILTSGQADTAAKGQEMLCKLYNQANKKIIIMPGAGISEDNVFSLVKSTGVDEIHASGKELIPSLMDKTALPNVVGDLTHYRSNALKLGTILQLANAAKMRLDNGVV